jgi:histidine triad (HIT) family protein
MESEQGNVESKNECRFCDPNFHGFRYKLKETEKFLVVCTEFPLCEGHVLIIPKKHFSCVGEFDAGSMEEFKKIYREVKDSLKNIYGSIAAFEHGKIGQTVFHSHVHIFPFGGDFDSIIAEGKSFASPLEEIDGLVDIYRKDGRYLFLSIGGERWTIDPKLGEPGFFLSRFARAMGKPDRADWKTMSLNDKLMRQVSREIAKFSQLWSAGDLSGKSSVCE